MIRDKPAFAASLLRDLLNVEVPHFDEARFTEVTLNELVPIEYRADAVVVFVDFIDKDKPMFGPATTLSRPVAAGRPGQDNFCRPNRTT